MQQNLARLLFVFFLALVASIARGEKGAKISSPSSPAPVLAGMGFIALPERPNSESVRIIYSEEEVDIVDLPEPKKN